MTLSKKVGWLAYGVALTVTLASFIVGCFTTVWDNDEAHHARMSLGFYMAGERVPHTPVAVTEDVPWDQFYYSDVLWPLLLSKLWLLAGQPSHTLAQFYQAIWLFALLIGLYRLSCLYYDPWTSLLAMGLTISIPVVIAFGTLFLTNIPAMTLTTWAIYAAHKLKKWRWVFLLGLLIGCIYLTKRLNVAFFPCIVLIGLVSTRENWQKRLTKLTVITVIAAGIIAIDIDYRTEHFNSRTLIKYKTLESYSSYVQPASVSSVKNKASKIYESDSILRWKDTLIHVSLFLPLALILYIFGRCYEWRDMLFVGLAAFYGIAFIAACLQINLLWTPPCYYIPSFVLLTTPAAKGLKRLRHHRLGRISLLVLGILAIVQLILVFQVVHTRRQLPKDLAEAYEYIRESLPDDEKVFLCSGYGLELHTGRLSTIRSITPHMFFQPSTSWQTRARILKELNIGYIIRREECVYDDREGQIIWNASGGMPQSFFEGLVQLSSYELVFKNDSVAIWKVPEPSSDICPHIAHK